MAENPGPLLVQLPKARRALDARYGDGGTASELDPTLLSRLRALDAERVGRGQMPMSKQDAFKVAETIKNQEPATPSPARDGWTDIPGNFIDDIATLGKSIPQLPKMLVNEVLDFADGFDDDIRQGGGGLAGLTNLPGIRMLPGAFVAKSLLSGEPSQLLRHPLFTALDVLPFASQAAGATKAFGLASEAATAAADAGKFAPKPRPLPTVLLNRIGESGALERNMAGGLVDAVGETAPLQFLKGAFGKVERTTAQLAHTTEAEMMDLLHGTKAEDWVDPDPFNMWARAAVKDATSTEARVRFGVPEQRIPELAKIASEQPELIAALPEAEQGLIGHMRESADRVAKAKGDMGIITQYGGEWYTKGSGARLKRAQQRALDSFGKISPSMGSVDARGRPTLWGRLESLAGDNPVWEPVAQAIDDGDWKTANGIVKGWNRAKLEPGPDSANPFSGSTRVTNGQVQQIIKTIREGVSADVTYARLKTKLVPARFEDLVNRRTMESVVSNLDADKAASLWSSFNDKMLLDNPLFDRKVWDAERSKIAATWQELKDAGADPVFIHRVAPEQAVRNILYPKVSSMRLPSISAAKDRLFDMSPAQGDPFVSIAHEYVEVLRNKFSRDYADSITQTFGTTQEKLVDQFRGKAISRAAFGGATDVGTALNSEITKQFVKFDPEKFGVSQVNLLSNTPDVWIPRRVANVLEALETPMKKGAIATFADPVTGAFRTALLPLSPRWNLYNILGGAVMVTADQGIKPWLKMSEAWDLTQRVRRGLTVDVSEQFRQSLGSLSRDEAEMSHALGGTLKRWFRESLESRGVSLKENAVTNQLGKGAKGFQKFTGKMFDLNARFDDMYRSMAYLAGKDTALTKGLSVATAERLGMDASRRVLQDIGSLTPFERSVLRPIMPFYGWMSHVVRYSTRFPLEHPWRAAVMSNVGRILQEDLGDPSLIDMLDAFTFGDVDKDGNQKAISLGGINPFSDVSSLFTLSGWLGQVNPVIKVGLNQLGVDTNRGGAELFPELRFDDGTGALGLAPKNPLSNLLYSTVPQAQIVAAIFGANAQFRDLVRRDPEAAARSIASAGGLPTLVKQVNKDTRMGKAELARRDSQKRVLSDALKSGDWSEARRYPALAEYLNGYTPDPATFNPRPEVTTGANVVLRGLSSVGDMGKKDTLSFEDLMKKPK